MHLLLIWIVNTGALWGIAHCVHGISADKVSTLFLASLAIGLINTFIRPVLYVLTLPINLLTLGLFSVVLNGVTFLAASKLVHGFYVSGLVPAMIASALYGVIAWLAHLIID